MLIGLCASCDAQITLTNSTSNKILTRVTVQGKLMDHGLPMWQFVEIKKSLLTTRPKIVTIQLIPILKSSNFRPLWAIANVRQCPPKGTYFFNFSIFAIFEKVINFNLAYFICSLS